MGRDFKKVTRKEVSYVPEMFIGVKKPLTFKLRTLSQKELARFTDSGTRLNVNSGMLILGTSEIEYDIARTVILGWDNLVVDGKEVSFQRGLDGKLDESIIEDIDGFFDILVEVGKYVSVITKFPEMAKGE